MERAQTDIIDPPLLKRDEFLHHIFDMGSIKYLFYSVMGDHDLFLLISAI
jgi:hypothetical protein